MKAFPAKYPGQCPECGLPFWPGDLIVRRGSGWGHAECPPIDQGIENALLRWWNDHAAEKERILRANLRAGMTPEEAVKALVLPPWVNLAIDRWAEETKFRARIALVNRATRFLLGRPLTEDEQQGGDPWFAVLDALREKGWSWREARKRMRTRLDQAKARKKARARALLDELALKLIREMESAEQEHHERIEN